MHTIKIDSENLNQSIQGIDGVGVYSFRDADGRYLYIGQSIMLYERMLSHKRFIDRLVSDYKMDSISIAYCDADQLDDLERRAIEYHMPLLNKELNRPKTYVDIKLKVPSFMAFKLKEMSIQSNGRDVSSLAIEGLEYVLSRPK